MSRVIFLSTAILLSLLSAVAHTAPAHKRHKPHWHDYGFLPGYRQPPNNNFPVFGEKGAIRSTSDDAPQLYWPTPEMEQIIGDPGCLGRAKDGSLAGPCWTPWP